MAIAFQFLNEHLTLFCTSNVQCYGEEWHEKSLGKLSINKTKGSALSLFYCFHVIVYAKLCDKAIRNKLQKFHFPCSFMLIQNITLTF